MYILREAYRSLLHLLYPHICAGCGRAMDNNETHVCITCFEELPHTKFEYLANNPIEKKFIGRLPLAAASAYCYFSAGSLIQTLIHEVKYSGNKELGYQLGHFMGEAIKASGRIKADALIPLPLFASKERKRGFNQSVLLCEGMSRSLQIPVEARLVKRTEHTDSQTKKGRMERWENVAGKFVVTGQTALRNKHLLLVDDVVTTGATLEACGLALLEIENVTLSIATLCVAGR